MPVPVLLRCPLLAEIEARLAARFEVHRIFDMADPAIEAVAPKVRALVTGGHLGAPADVISRLPSIEIIAINGVGYDQVDLDAAAARKIRVTNTPDVLTDDVADLAIT